MPRWQVPIAAALLLSPAAIEAQAGGRMEAYLTGELGLTRRNLMALSRGRPVTRVLDTTDPREIAVVGVVRIPVPAETFVEQAVDVAGLLRGRTVTGAGELSDPAIEEDLSGLNLPTRDVEDLERCRAGDCRVKLPEGVIADLSALDWSGALPRREAENIFRAMLLEHATAYREGRPIPPYADKRQPVSPVDGFGRILRERPYLLAFLPNLRNHMLDFPHATAIDTEDAVLWTEERFGLKPVISLNHVSVHQPRRPGAVDVIVALKQLYASHYFEASAGLLAFVEVAEAPGSYFVYIRHHRFDGTLNPGQRRLIEAQIRTYVGDLVSERAARLEAAAAN